MPKSTIVAPQMLPTRFQHQTRLIGTLSPQSIKTLCSILYMPPSMHPVPTTQWLASQAVLVTHLPTNLRLPSYRRPDGTSRHDGQAVLCSGHEGLNGYVMSALMAMLCAECEYYNQRIRGYAGVEILGEILSNQEASEAVGQRGYTGELHVGNRCAACILAAVGSHRLAVETLSTAMYVGYDRGMRECVSVLDKLLEEWAKIQNELENYRPVLRLGQRGILYWQLWNTWKQAEKRGHGGANEKMSESNRTASTHGSGSSSIPSSCLEYEPSAENSVHETDPTTSTPGSSSTHAPCFEPNAKNNTYETDHIESDPNLQNSCSEQDAVSTSRAPPAGTPRRRTVEDEYGHLGYDDDDSDDYVRIPRSHPPPVRRGDAIETLFTVRKKNGKMSKAKQRLLLVSTPRGEEIRGVQFWPQFGASDSEDEPEPLKVGSSGNASTPGSGTAVLRPPESGAERKPTFIQQRTSSRKATYHHQIETRPPLGASSPQVKRSSTEKAPSSSGCNASIPRTLRLVKSTIERPTPTNLPAERDGDDDDGGSKKSAIKKLWRSVSRLELDKKGHCAPTPKKPDAYMMTRDEMWDAIAEGLGGVIESDLSVAVPPKSCWLSKSLSKLKKGE